MKKIIFALALLLVFSGCVIRAPGPGDCPQGSTWNGAANCCRENASMTCMDKSIAKSLMLWEDWIGFGIFFVLMGFFIMGIAYMIAYAFDFKTLQIFVKNEIVQLCASALLFGLVVSGTYLVDEFAQQSAAQVLMLSGGSGVQPIRTTSGTWQITGFSKRVNVTQEDRPGGVWNGRWVINEIGPGDTFVCESPCHFYLARGYLGMVYEKIAMTARSVVKAYATLSWIDYVRVGMFVNVLGIVFGLKITLMPFTGLGMVYRSLGTCFDLMAKAMVSVKFQEMTLLYIQNGVFPIFLISGIILRSVWFLRKLGGLLLATAICLYTIFPLLYVLCWYTVETSTTTLDIDASMVPNTNGFSTSLLPWKMLNLNLNNDEVRDMLFTKYNPATNEPDSLGILDITGGLMLPALAIPLLNIFITLAAIKTLSASLGGDVEIAGLTRLI